MIDAEIDRRETQERRAARLAQSWGFEGRPADAAAMTRATRHAIQREAESARTLAELGAEASAADEHGPRLDEGQRP